MDLYSEIILDYYKNPRNKGEIKDADYTGELLNTSCGDRIKIFLKTAKTYKTGKAGKVVQAAFEGEGCAISQAAASMLTEKLIGKSPAEIKKITDKDIIKMLNIPISPGRIKCALISLEATKKAIE